MTDPNEIDQASLDRIARLQQRRQPRVAAPATPAPRPGRRRRRSHPAASGRVLAAGLGATTMFGITAALAVAATADTGTQPDTGLAVAPVLPTESITAADALPFEGELPPGFDVDDIDVGSIPEGGVLTGELSEDGRPVVVVLHPRTTPVRTTTVAPAAPVIAAPTPLTAIPVVTEVAVPAAPAPVATTSGS